MRVQYTRIYVVHSSASRTLHRLRTLKERSAGSRVWEYIHACMHIYMCVCVYTYRSQRRARRANLFPSPFHAEALYPWRPCATVKRGRRAYRRTIHSEASHEAERVIFPVALHPWLRTSKAHISRQHVSALHRLFFFFSIFFSSFCFYLLSFVIVPICVLWFVDRNENIGVGEKCMTLTSLSLAWSSCSRLLFGVLLGLLASRARSALCAFWGCCCPSVLLFPSLAAASCSFNADTSFSANVALWNNTKKRENYQSVNGHEFTRWARNLIAETKIALWLPPIFNRPFDFVSCNR